MIFLSSWIENFRIENPILFFELVSAPLGEEEHLGRVLEYTRKPMPSDEDKTDYKLCSAGR